MQGALKSWAVPKGPSMNPAEKRLAVEVEDHQLDYASFEGIIPEGQYGAGEVVIWDAGLYKGLGGSLSGGMLEFELVGKKLRGGFVLRKMAGKKKEWLLIKRKDGFSDYAFKLETVLPAKRSGP